MSSSRNEKKDVFSGIRGILFDCVIVTGVVLAVLLSLETTAAQSANKKVSAPYVLAENSYQRLTIHFGEPMEVEIIGRIARAAGGTGYVPVELVDQPGRIDAVVVRDDQQLNIGQIVLVQEECINTGLPGVSNCTLHLYR